MSTKEIKPVTLKIRPVETKTEIDERGAFQRQPNHFTRPFGDGEGELKQLQVNIVFSGRVAAIGQIVLPLFVNCLALKMLSLSIKLVTQKTQNAVNTVGNLSMSQMAKTLLLVQSI